MKSWRIYSVWVLISCTNHQPIMSHDFIQNNLELLPQRVPHRTNAGYETFAMKVARNLHTVLRNPPSLSAMWVKRGSLLCDSNTHVGKAFTAADPLSMYTAFTNQKQCETLQFHWFLYRQLMNSLDFIFTSSSPSKAVGVYDLSCTACVTLYNHWDFTFSGLKCWLPLTNSLTYFYN